MFPERSFRVIEGKKANVGKIFDMRLHVIEEHSKC